MKSLFTLLLLVYLGCMPYQVWNVLSGAIKAEIGKDYALFYLTEKDYCDTATVSVQTNVKNNTVEFYANCDKVKI
jgi:hypothetical protein